MEKSDLGHHYSQKFNAELEAIRSDVPAMGGMVEQQLNLALSALSGGHPETGDAVVTNDNRVKEHEVEIDERCTGNLARGQPTASDLRLVLTVIETTTDFERIGDEAKRIATMAIRLASSGHGRVDQEYENVMRQSMIYKMEDPRSIPFVLDVMWPARALERIGDRCCNIFQYIIYFIMGKDVRRISLEKMQEKIFQTEMSH